MKRLLTAVTLLLTAMLSASSQTVPLGPRFVLPYQTVIDSTGVPLNGALLYFYSSGTNTPLATYSDPLLTVPNSNPVVANAAGVFPNIFLNGNYKVILKDSSFQQIWAADPVDSALLGGGTLPFGAANQIPVYTGAGATVVPTTVGGVGGFFDTICSSVIGQAWVRMTNGWGCSALGFYNPVWFGAKGDNSTDDHTALANMITAAANGVIFWPLKQFCNKSMLTESYQGSTWTGVATISACGSSNTLVEFNGSFQFIDQGVTFQGPISTVNPTLIFGTNCIACRFTGEAYGGVYPIDNYSPELFLDFANLSDSYGSAQLFDEDGSNVVIERGRIDQQTACGATGTVSVWQANHNYSSLSPCITVYTPTSDLIIQLTTTGTSGATDPCLTLSSCAYGTSIADGTARWFLVGRTELCAVRQHGTGGINARFSDFSGGYNGGSICLTNNSADVPQSIVLTNNSMSAFTFGLFGSYGDVVQSYGNNVNCILTSCVGYYFASTFSGIATSIGDDFFSGSGVGTGISILGGASSGEPYIVSGDTFSGWALAANIGNNVSDVTLANNFMGTTGFGANTNTVTIGTGGDYIYLSGNNFHGAGTPAITNSSTGTNNRIVGNLGYNPLGLTAGTSTGTSTSTITAGPSPETHYITQSANFNAVVKSGSTTLCTVPSATVPCVIELGPNESYSVSWTTTQPTYSKFVH